MANKRPKQREIKVKVTMPKAVERPIKVKMLPADFNQVAQHLVRVSTEQDEQERLSAPTQSDIARVMAELGRRGGKIGGKRRLETLSQERRSQIAFKAAQVRWAKKAKKP